MTVQTNLPEDYEPADRSVTKPVQFGDAKVRFHADGQIEVVEGDIDAETIREFIREIRRPRRVGFLDEGIEHSVPVDENGIPKTLPPLDLPGMGEAYEDCNDEITLGCECCGWTTDSHRTCKRSMCPRCGAAWCRDRAANVLAWLEATRKRRNAIREANQKFHHCVLSPPDDWALEADDVLGRTMTMIYAALRTLDLDGYVFYHPRRLDTGEGVDDMDLWKEYLFSGYSAEELRQETSFEPHFHCVVVGDHVPGKNLSATVYEETGWIFKRITGDEDDPVSISDFEQCARVVTYCLSHTGIDTSGENNVAKYNPFGMCRPSSDTYVKPQDRERAEYLARKVAPTTLGLPMKEQLCTEVAKEKASAAQLDRSTMLQVAMDDREEMPDEHPDELDATAPDPDVDPERTDELPERSAVATERDEEEWVECEGIMRPIEALEDKIEDPEWREEARHSGMALRALQEWRRQHGKSDPALGDSYQTPDPPDVEDIRDPPDTG